MLGLLILAVCPLLHLFITTLLGLRNWEQQQKETTQSVEQVSELFIQCNGILVTGATLLVVVLAGTDDPLVQCILRILAFFYGSKILDLSVTKASNPPVLVATDNYNLCLDSWAGVTKYALRLITEMRYHSFDIAVEQKQRPATAAQDYSIAKPAIAMCILAAIDYFLRSPELKCVCLLLLLQVSFESLHSLLHPNCKHPLFYQPFSAASAGAFWTTHWHAGAASFLQSLGFRPGKRLGGRILGVLATFNLTGIWHGWASAALAEDDYALGIGLQVWGFFMLQGMFCIVERVIWKDKQGGMVQRLFVWAISIASAGQCLRSLQKHTKVPILSA